MESSNEEICVYLDYRYEEGADVENSENVNAAIYGDF